MLNVFHKGYNDNTFFHGFRFEEREGRMAGLTPLFPLHVAFPQVLRLEKRAYQPTNQKKESIPEAKKL